jgi:hypothetical protein
MYCLTHECTIMSRPEKTQRERTAPELLDEGEDRRHPGWPYRTWQSGSRWAPALDFGDFGERSRNGSATSMVYFSCLR